MFKKRRRRWRAGGVCTAVEDGAVMRDLRSVTQARGAIGHDALARGKPRLDDRELLVLVPDRDFAPVCHVIGADDVEKIAVRAELHRGGRHGDGAALDAREQAHVDETAGPEALAGIGECRLQLDGAGGAVHLVVEHRERAGIQHHRRRVGGRGRGVPPAAAVRPGPPAPAPRHRRAARTLRQRLHLHRPACCAARTAPSCCCGSVKMTEIGCICAITTSPLVSLVWMMLP